MGQQHYRFAFGGLTQFAFAKPAELLELLRTEPQRFLPWLWEQCADGPSEPYPLLSARVFELEGQAAALVSMPEPKVPPQAYFVLILFGTDPAGVYSLEKAKLVNDQDATVLGRWLPDRRENLGVGPAPVAEAFIESVLSIVDKRSSESP